MRDSLSVVLLAVPPEEVGQMIGGAFVPLALLAGALKCAQLMRRPTTSTVCVTALFLLLLGWGLASLMTLAAKWWPVPPIANVISGVVMMLIVLGSLVVAIVGLATYDRRRFVQGRKQAIWTLVLSGVFLLTVVAGFVAARGKKMRVASLPREELAKHGCALTPPPGWVSFSPKALRFEAAATGYRRMGPEMYMVLIAENLGSLADMKLATEVVKANLQGGAEVTEQREEDVMVRGLPFHHISSLAKTRSGDLELAYEHWLVAKDGFLWQLLVWGPPAQRPAVMAEARQFAEGFEPLDTAASAAGSIEDVDHPEHGFRTRLAGLGWQAGGPLLLQNPLAAFSAARTHECVQVMPIHLDDKPPDLEALTRGLLSRLGFEHPLTAPGTAQRSFTSPVGEGVEIATTHEVAGDTFDYVLRIFRGERHAVLVAGWAMKKGGDMKRVREALDAIVLRPPTGEPPPLNAAGRQALQLVLNESALSLYGRKDFDGAAHWFWRAFEQTKSDANILGNCVNALEAAGRQEDALAVLKPQLERFPKAFDLQARRAFLLAATGEADAGETHFLGLIKQGLKDETQLIEWLGALVKVSRHDLAEQAATAWIAERPSPRARRWLADVVSQSGDAKRALGMMESLATEYPDDEAVAVKLAALLNDASEFTRAGDIAGKLLSTQPENPRALEVLAWSQYGRKWYREAKASFERASRLAPDDEMLKDAVRRVSAMLGQGNNSDIKEPIDPVPLPDSVARELSAKPLPEEMLAGQPAVFLARSTGYRFESGKPLRRTVRHAVKVLNQTGVDAFSSMDFGFDPLGERIYVNRLEVRDATGKPVGKGSLDDAFVRDAESSVGSHRKILQVQVPGLQPGGVVEIDVTIEDRSVEKEFPFRRHLFAYGVPCAAEVVFLSGESSGIPHATAQGREIQALKGDGHRGWLVHALPASESEPMATSVETRAPLLWLGGSRESWAGVAREYLAQIGDRLEAAPNTAARARELCADAKTDREKIARLAREVQKQVTYKALEFGIRARRPNAADDTLRQCFGDCKDHALLLHQLLRAAGIESHLALVHTDRRTAPELPSLDQFNHMVLHVPALGSGWLLDATDKYQPLDALPAALWASHALVLDPAKPRLLPQQTSAPAGSSRLESRRTISPEGGDWLVDETLSIAGYYGAWFRAMFAGQTPAEQRQRAQTILAGVGTAELKDFRFENLDEIATPARLALSYRVRGAIKTTAGRAQAPLPALWEREYVSLAFVPKRTTPCLLRYPFQFASQATVHLPPEARLTALTQQGRAPAADWDLKAQPATGKTTGAWTVNFDFRSRSGEHAADRYPALYEAWASARRAWDANAEWTVP